MSQQGFDNSYFENYLYFDSKKKTPYENKHLRYMGNACIPYAMYDLYNILFDSKPETYVDLGCGTGEEMAFYKNKGCRVQGCDFSNYVLERINPSVSKFIINQDSVSFMDSYRNDADIVWENTLQYLNDKDFDSLMKLIKEKTSQSSILGVLYDETERQHPYRKQVHEIKWWESKLEEYGFISSKKVAEKIGINIGGFVRDISPYVFVKNTSLLKEHKDYDFRISRFNEYLKAQNQIV